MYVENVRTRSAKSRIQDQDPAAKSLLTHTVLFHPPTAVPSSANSPRNGHLAVVAGKLHGLAQGISMGSLRLTGLLLGTITALGCGGSHPSYSTLRPPRAAAAGTIEPTSNLERSLLGRLDTLSEGQALKSAEGMAVVDRVYTAASGRRCRTVHLRFSAQQAIDRLACNDAEHWFFVPTLNATAPGAADTTTANHKLAANREAQP